VVVTRRDPGSSDRQIPDVGRLHAAGLLTSGTAVCQNRRDALEGFGRLAAMWSSSRYSAAKAAGSCGSTTPDLAQRVFHTLQQVGAVISCRSSFRTTGRYPAAADRRPGAGDAGAAIRYDWRTKHQSWGHGRAAEATRVASGSPAAPRRDRRAGGRVDILRARRRRYVIEVNPCPAGRDCRRRCTWMPP